MKNHRRILSLAVAAMVAIGSMVVPVQRAEAFNDPPIISASVISDKITEKDKVTETIKIRIKSKYYETVLLKFAVFGSEKGNDGVYSSYKIKEGSSSNADSNGNVKLKAEETETITFVTHQTPTGVGNYDSKKTSKIYLYFKNGSSYYIAPCTVYKSSGNLKLFVETTGVWTLTGQATEMESRAPYDNIKSIWT